MITLYTWMTPNGRKVPIMLEELGWPYQVHPVNLGKNEQFGADFLKISPNNKIPAIVDHDAQGGPLSIFESGAILTYLAEKSGQFLAQSGPERYRAIEWLHWQIGSLGPMLGQLGYFAKRATDKAHAKVFADMGGYAPTIGIIGTVLSLVHVLENLDKPEELGHMIGGAFIATLWGVLSANVLFLPWASKLKRMSELEAQAMELTIEGLMSIQAGSNPRVIEQKLKAFLPAAAAEPDEKAA